jgi:predicted acyltransferase
MDTESLVVFAIFPGMFIFLAIVYFVGEPAHIQRKSILPFLALVLAAAFFVAVVIYTRRLPEARTLRFLSKIAFALSVFLIIDAIRYGDWQDAAKAVLMIAAGILIDYTGEPVLKILGGVISGATGLWELFHPSSRVLSRTVGYLPETLWHVAKAILMFLIFAADIGSSCSLLESL